MSEPSCATDADPGPSKARLLELVKGEKYECLQGRDGKESVGCIGLGNLNILPRLQVKFIAQV